MAGRVATAHEHVVAGGPGLQCRSHNGRMDIRALGPGIVKGVEDYLCLALLVLAVELRKPYVETDKHAAPESVDIKTSEFFT